MFEKPAIIGHRGACGYRPEHTLESYRLAAELGADLLEPDLVSTGDGVLVCRHENEIGGSTDVAGRPEFAGRRATKVVDGRQVTGWFTEDFTLAELKTLRARERLPRLRPQNTAFDGRFPVPTFDELLDLREQLSAEHGRTLAVYPETKHPSYFRSIGLALEEPLVEALRVRGLAGRDAPVVIQSFETGNLRALRSQVGATLVQLLGGADRRPADDARTYGELASPRGLADIAGYADAIGPAKQLIVPWDADDRSLEPTTLVEDAHAAGLEVHPFTFRRENAFLPRELRSSEDRAGVGDLTAELRRFYDLGVDAVFTDNPDVAAAARR